MLFIECMVRRPSLDYAWSSSTPKDEGGVSCAEQLYGTVLTLPGEFVTENQPPPVEFLDRLRAVMEPGRVPPSRVKRADQPSVPVALRQAGFVFVSRDGHIPPLDQWYAGPNRVEKKNDSTFLVEIGNRVEEISIEHLKPVFGEDVEPATPPATW